MIDAKVLNLEKGKLADIEWLVVKTKITRNQWSRAIPYSWIYYTWRLKISISRRRLNR